MYRLVNKYGNAEMKTESAVERDRLIGQGYRLVEEDDTAPAEPSKDTEDEGAADAAMTPSVTADGGATSLGEGGEEGETAPAEPKKKGKGKAAAEDDKKE